MWTHVMEAVLTGVGLFVVPLAFVAAMAGTLALLDRVIYSLGARHHRI